MPTTITGTGAFTGATTINGLSLPSDNLQPGFNLITPTSIAYSNGSASASGGAVTFSGVSSVSLNGCFSATYDNYRIMLNITSATVGSQAVVMRMRSTGTDNSSSLYGITQIYSVFSGTSISAGNNSSAATSWVIKYLNDTASTSAALDIIAPNLTARTIMQSNGANLDAWSIYMGNHNSTTQFDGFSVYLASGNMTGTLRVYGYRN
jgi:hypothetical protein